jgi:hypothetical protein
MKLAPNIRRDLEIAIFDFVRDYERTGIQPQSPAPDHLPDELKAAMQQCDVPALISAGVHPCLAITFAYANEVYRPAFIHNLPPVTLSKEAPRWRTS